MSAFYPIHLKFNYVLAYLRLMRPANIITALADILLGFAVAGGVNSGGASFFQISLEGGQDLAWLLMATIGLYGGGVVLNDVFDADLDLAERPERPIPSGQVSERSASLMGILLLLGGVVAAAQVTPRSALIAGLVAALATLYDAFGKHHPFWGPLNMGSCRSGNVLLGMSVVPLTVWGGWVALIPLLYIAAITLISRGEVEGSSQRPLQLGFFIYLLVIGMILAIYGTLGGAWFLLLPFLMVFAGLILPPLFKAWRHPIGPNIGKAVKAGVLALIPMDAALALAFSDWPYALLILALLPVSLLLARVFAVT